MIVFSIFPIKARFIRWQILGIILAITGLLLFGPSNLLPDNIYLMGFGAAFIGVCGGIIGLSSILILMLKLK